MIMLSDTANNVAITLKNWRWSTYGANILEIDEAPIAQEDFPRPENKWLFSYIKDQLPELKNIVSFESLRAVDFSEKLEELLRTCAEKREFPGKCDMCQDWENPEE